MTLEGLHIVNAYIEEIKPQFSESELATIANSLYYTSGMLSDKVSKRMEEISKRSHEP